MGEAGHALQADMEVCQQDKKIQCGIDMIVNRFGMGVGLVLGYAV